MDAPHRPAYDSASELAKRLRINALLAHCKDLSNTEEIASSLMDLLEATELQCDKLLNQGKLLGGDKRRALNDLCVEILA